MKKSLLALAIAFAALNAIAQSIPTITNVTPTFGPIGTTVTISGTNFDPVTTNNVVHIGGVRAEVIASTATQLTVLAPAGDGAGKISVTNLSNGKTANTEKTFSATFDFPCGNLITPESFGGRVTIASGLSPQSISTADFDGDGKLDYAVANTSGKNKAISVLRNTSSGSSISFSKWDYGVLSEDVEAISICVAEFDGDGKPDIVLLYKGSFLFKVLTNTSSPGTTSFSATFFNVGVFDLATVADFDGDGKNDIALRDKNNEGVVSLLRNTSSLGMISFAPKQNIQVNGRVDNMSTSDLNGDGKPELIIGVQSSQSFIYNASVFRNVSVPGTIAFTSSYNTAGGLRLLFISDVDGDEKSDMLFATSSGTSILRNVTTLTDNISFVQSANLPGALIFQTADIDGDGVRDFAASTGSVNTVALIKNLSIPGTISFAEKVDYALAASPQSIAIADFTGDGVPEVAAATPTSNAAIILRRLPVCPAPAITSVSSFTGIAGDVITINGSNFSSNVDENVVTFSGIKANIVSANANQLVVTIPSGVANDYLSVTNVVASLTAYCAKPFNTVFNCNSPISLTSFGSKVTSSPIGTTPKNIHSADFDGDGKQDVAVTTSNPSVSVLRNNGIGTTISFDAGVNLPMGGVPSAMAVADLDGDGRPDIVATNGAVGSITASVFFNRSTPGNISFTAKSDLNTNTNPRDVKIGDLDGDGKPEIVVSNDGGTGTSAVSVFRNLGKAGLTFFATKMDFNAGTSRFDNLALADADADGKLDVVVANYSIQGLSTLRNISSVGNIAFESKTDHVTTNYPTALGLADLDGDDKLDIAFVTSGTNTASVLKNLSSSGNISFGSQENYVVGSSPNMISLGDLDGDGKIDLGISHTYAASISLLRNISSGSDLVFADNVSLGASSITYCIFSDLDRDGKLDIAMANSNQNNVSTYRNLTYRGPAMTSPNTATICSGTAIALSFGSDLPSTYQWVATDNANITGESISVQTGSVLSDTLQNNASSVETVTYTVTPTSIAGSCIGTPQTITVTVNPVTTAPTVTTPVQYCQNATAVPLSATGNNLLWYTVSNGGTGSSTAPTPLTAAIGSTSYYVSQTNNSCEGPRAIINVQVLSAPATPSIAGESTVCQNGLTTLSAVTNCNNCTYSWSNGPATSPFIYVGVGQYSVTLTDPVTGCSTASPIKLISEYQANTTGLYITATSNCYESSSITLTAPASQTNYSWSRGGTSLNKTTRTITVNAEGNYYVSMSSNTKRACVTVYPCAITRQSTHNNDNPQDVTLDARVDIEPLEFALYPNPVDNEINVELPSKTIEDVPLTMYNQMGVLIKTIIVRKGTYKVSVDTKHIPAGLYLIELNTGGMTYKQKVIVRHNN